MTALHTRTVKAIRGWCRVQKMMLTSPPRHVHPRCYVIARLSLQCIIVAVPECDRELHLRGAGYRRCDEIRKFDPTLEQGDWCSTAYVKTASSGEQVAIRMVE